MLFTPQTQVQPIQQDNKALDDMIGAVRSIMQIRQQEEENKWSQEQRNYMLKQRENEEKENEFLNQRNILDYGEEKVGMLRQSGASPKQVRQLLGEQQEAEQQTVKRQIESAIISNLGQGRYKTHSEFAAEIHEAGLDPKSYKQYWDEWQEERRRLLSGSGSAEDTVYNASILQAQAPGVNAANLSKKVVGEAAAELTAANKELSNLKATLNPMVTNSYNFSKNPDGALVFTAKNTPDVKYALTANGNFFRYSVSKNIFEPADIMDKLVINKIMTPEERKDLRGTYNKYIKYVEAYNRRDTIIKAATAAGQNPYDLKTKDYYK